MIYFRTFAATLAVTLLVLAPLQLVQGQTDPCATAITNLLTTCVSQASISLPNFLWFVSNATSASGQAPTNADQFKTQICNAENQVGQCIFSQLGNIANTTCQSNQALPTKIASYVFTYDMKCANPCRATLVDDLRKCYTDKGLSGNLFLSNRTGGSVIGANKADVDKFCMNKEPLMSCLTNVQNACPDALPMLAQVDFNLDAYKKGVDILCAHVADYLLGLTCFAESTPEVDACGQKNQQALLQLSVEASSKNWTQDQFRGAACKNIMNQIDCDGTAWQNKKHEACTKGAVGLKVETECKLLPPNCPELQKPVYDQICNQNKFFANERIANGGGATGISGGQVGAGATSFMEANCSLLLLTLATVVLPYFKSSQ